MIKHPIHQEPVAGFLELIAKYQSQPEQHMALKNQKTRDDLATNLVAFAKKTSPEDWKSRAKSYLSEASYLFETDITPDLAKDINAIPRSVFLYLYFKAILFLVVKHPAMIDLNIDLVTSITKNRSYTELVNRFALLEKDGITLQGIFKRSSSHT